MTAGEPLRPGDHELAALAKAGDTSALAELRRRGYFLRLKEEGRRSPLSRAQFRLWLLERFGADGDAYNLPGVYQVAEDMDADALAKAFAWLSARHGQLRAHFPEEDGGPVQAVEAAASFAPPFEVRSAPGRAAALDDVRRWAAEGFAMSRPKLWRAGWWRIGGNGGLFAWVFHHAIADEWSLDLLAGELARAYRAYAEGKEPDIPAPSLSYFDWTAGEAAYVAGSRGMADRDWWLATWSRPPPPVELPADFPRPAERSFAGSVAESAWEPALVHRIADLARRERVTPFVMAMTLTRAFLFRLTGQDDAAIGFPYANRGAPGADSVAGFMANTLALRRRFDPRAPFIENLRREDGFVREALARGAYPFDLLVERAAQPRDPSRSPVFDIMATLRETGGGAGRAPGFSPVPAGYAKARFDAVFEWKGLEQGLAGLDITYATSLFTPARVRDWLAGMATMAGAMAANPAAPAAELPVFDAAAHAAAVECSEGPSVPLPWTGAKRPPLAWMWEENLAAHAERPAVEDAEGAWTYRELDSMSRRVAAALRLAGIRDGDRVASALPRSRPLAAVLWGIWRSGGVYVPIEPAWPAERRRFVVEDAGARLIFADAPVDVSGPARLDAAAVLASGSPEADGAGGWTADGLAYIIYTSGSTGTPKGVAVAPGGVVNMALAQARAFGLRPEDRALALASTAFDASIAEMLAGWAAGACVVMAPDGILSDARALAEWLPRSRTTLATMTPALLALLPADAFAGMRTLLTAGEAARGGDILRLLGGMRVFNAYGPTECSVCAALHEVAPEDCADPFGVPIGLPIANIEAHVLDASGQPCLPDTPGDLHLGGIGLARGYWNRPDLTRQAFAPGPGGGILYRTGDRVRRRRDGRLVFLGRLDDQVKIRGNRVETGEVARALADALPGLATAVLPRRIGGETELVALIAGSEADAGVARRALAERLPPAMRPGRYVTVDTLPRDSNGKIDRKALPGLLAAADGEGAAGREPSLPYEREILAAWREALGHERLSVSDDFFLAGGHSLSSLRAAALTAERTGLAVTGRDILSHPTVEGLAAALIARALPDGRGAAVPAVPVQGGNARDGAAATSGVTGDRLDGLVAQGALPPLDAAALGYFPDAPPAGIPEGVWTRDRVLGDWCGGGATLLHVYDTRFGRTGLVALPLFHTDLFGDPGRLMDSVGEGLAMARACGARVVSLTGMLPSVSRGGAAIAERFPAPGWPVVTHGHATTAAALLKGTGRLLAAAGRDWREATAGFLGLGSIGMLTAGLWLETHPPPKRLILADVPSKRRDLEELAAAWSSRSPAGMRVDILSSPAAPPPEWYEADLMLCAVGSGEIVDVSRLRPGTLLADDSAPPCFSWERAAERMRGAGDILAAESGDLALPEPWTRLSYRPASLRDVLRDEEAVHPDDARRMTSCVLSGLLLANGLTACPRTLGTTPPAVARAHWLELEGLGIEAPGLRCGTARPDGILRAEMPGLTREGAW